MKNIAILLFFFLNLLVIPVLMGQEVIYTANNNGRLENCNCVKDPLGSMEKFIAEVERRSKLNETIRFNAGNFLSESADSLNSTAMLQLMGLVNWDAITLGQQELQQGDYFVGKILSDFPVVSANLVDDNDEHCAKSYLTVERSGQSWFITAVTEPYQAHSSKSKYRFANPFMKLMEVPVNQSPGTRLVIMVNGSDKFQASIAERYSGCDLMILGKRRKPIESIEKIGEVPTVYVGGETRYLGSAKFFGPRLRAELVPLVRKLPDSREAIDIIKEYHLKRMSH